MQRERFCLGLHPHLIGGRFGDGCFTGGVSLLDLCIPLCQGRSDVSLFLNLSDLRSAHVGDVIVLVAYIFNRERDDFQAHLLHIGSDGLEHLRADILRVFDQVFNCELANNAAQVTFHYQADQAFALLLAFTEELLGSGLHALFVRAHLDLCDGLDIHGHSL